MLFLGAAYPWLTLRPSALVKHSGHGRTTSIASMGTTCNFAHVWWLGTVPRRHLLTYRPTDLPTYLPTLALNLNYIVGSPWAARGHGWHSATTLTSH